MDCCLTSSEHSFSYIFTTSRSLQTVSHVGIIWRCICCLQIFDFLKDNRSFLLGSEDFALQPATSHFYCNERGIFKRASIRLSSFDSSSTANGSAKKLEQYPRFLNKWDHIDIVSCIIKLKLNSIWIRVLSYNKQCKLPCIHNVVHVLANDFLWSYQNNVLIANNIIQTLSLSLFTYNVHCIVLSTFASILYYIDRLDKYVWNYKVILYLIKTFQCLLFIVVASKQSNFETLFKSQDNNMSLQDWNLT